MEKILAKKLNYGDTIGKVKGIIIGYNFLEN